MISCCCGGLGIGWRCRGGPAPWEGLDRTLRGEGWRGGWFGGQVPEVEAWRGGEEAEGVEEDG